MGTQKIRDLLERVAAGELTIDEAVSRLRVLPYENLGFAKIDHHRSLRTGFPEVIYCQGKALEQIIEIIDRMQQREQETTILATRATLEIASALREVLPEAEYHSQARMVVIRPRTPREGDPKILVLSAGTADIPVAEEAAVTASALGGYVERIYDVGVAGIHRLLDHHHQISQAAVIVVVAGMEGALPSVVSGLVEVPVIAVPTSVGYGSSFDGLAALLTMLNSCAAGVAVMNIDNGFGGGYFARMLTRQICRRDR
ncbi:MAG: 1-(5-phosphoribosyl)-5-amino-4-imidazole-carboxylate carboxylase [Armatimonadetes bacterium CG_4_9_14_3_um_filter_58_7]|nr:MAG: 1-(5-phosphoribosyl)-5-amino-4-imidazole-carboxylate carboxylase [Armatimonadetes bacterium CG_4_9_14_3_um_filter_58_7]